MDHVSSMIIEDKWGVLPFNVAMEEPDARVISPKSEHHVSIRSDEDDVSAHWHLWESDIVCIETLIVLRTGDELEVVTVKMEWMFAWVIVI